MPQLQEGDEIVHINGRTVKELPHQEVLCLLLFSPSHYLQDRNINSPFCLSFAFQ